MTKKACMARADILEVMLVHGHGDWKRPETTWVFSLTLPTKLSNHGKPVLKYYLFISLLNAWH